LRDRNLNTPLFFDLGGALGVHVVVVTFSSQVKLIREVLAAVFPSEISAGIVLRGSDRSWQYEGCGSNRGKQAHIASANEELNMMCGSCSTKARGGDASVTRASTLLIDDEMENVAAALESGTNAILYNYNDPELSFVQALLTLPAVSR
jgi:hypothetical protein